MEIAREEPRGRPARTRPSVLRGAGRRPEPLSELARELSLSSVTLTLDDPALLRQELEQFHCVVHAAGPFVHTSRPMLEACLESGTHYVDITGELSVFEDAFELHEAALRSRVALILKNRIERTEITVRIHS